MSSHHVTPIEILLVEDNRGDVRLTAEALRDAKVANVMQVVSDGVEAMQYLRREGRFASATRPDLVLLDLNLPRKDGREVLAEIKADPDLGRIPVVILTSSGDEADVVHAYDSHANCFITKPVEIEKFFEVVRSIEGFWLTVVRLPNGRS
jgi:two-component system, chemotaxis family, response regulator Rcp1